MLKGTYKRTEEQRRKLRIARKGRKPNLGNKHSDAAKIKMSISHKGKKHNKDWNVRIRQSKIGKKRKPFSEEWKRKIGDSKRGNKSNLWKGGITNNPYPTDWTETLRRSIRERDNYICQLCSQYGNEVHHIDYNKQNCNPNNLITLCLKCHPKTSQNRNYWYIYFNNKQKII